MANKYAVIGNGPASDKSLIAALNDLPEDAIFVCQKNAKGTESQGVVWNWLIDQEREFSIYGVLLGKSFNDYATEVGEGSMQDVIDMADQVLVLWDDTPELEEAILYAARKKKPILELTNGLSAIEVEDDVSGGEGDRAGATAVADAAPADDEEESEPLTKADLEGMPAAAVKRYAKEQGINISGKTKVEIIDCLFPLEPMDWYPGPQEGEDSTCVCGKPETEGTVHRTDGPCYAEDVPYAQEAVPAPEGRAKPVMIYVVLDNGGVLTFTGEKLLRKIMDIL